MFCNNCGKELSVGSAFCIYCGAKMPKPEEKPVDLFEENPAPAERPAEPAPAPAPAEKPAEPAPAPAEKPAEPAPKKKKGNGGLVAAIIIIAVLLLAALAAAAFFLFKMGYFGGKDPESKVESVVESKEESKEDSKGGSYIDEKHGIKTMADFKGKTLKDVEDVFGELKLDSLYRGGINLTTPKDSKYAGIYVFSAVNWDEKTYDALPPKGEDKVLWISMEIDAATKYPIDTKVPATSTLEELKAAYPDGEVIDNTAFEDYDYPYGFGYKLSNGAYVVYTWQDKFVGGADAIRISFD